MYKKALPKDLTSYDLLKTFAVVIMVIDHIGFYFFPEMLWLRAIGRMSAPIFLFLIGYARRRDISVQWLGGGVILLACNIIVGMPIFPLNILFTIIFIRLVLDWFMRKGFDNASYIWSFSVILAIAALPADFISEYGMQALITAIYGYYVRHREEAGKCSVERYMLFSFFIFVMYQQIIFWFGMWEFLLMFAGVLVVHLALLEFSAQSYSKLTERVPRIATWFCQLCGRHTLGIYVAHLMAFKFLAAYMGFEGFNWFDVQIVAPELVKEFSELITI